MASPAFVSLAETTDASGSTLAMGLPSHSAGDILVLFVGQTAGSTTPATATNQPAGWSTAEDGEAGNASAVRLTCFYKVGNGSESSVNVSFGQTVTATAMCMAFSGASGDVDVSAVATQETGVDMTAPAVTTTVTNTTIIHGFIFDDDVSTESDVDSDGGFQGTLRAYDEAASAGNGYAMAVADLTQAAIGNSGTCEFSTNGDSDAGVAITIAISGISLVEFTGDAPAIPAPQVNETSVSTSYHALAGNALSFTSDLGPTGIVGGDPHLFFSVFEWSADDVATTLTQDHDLTPTALTHSARLPAGALTAPNEVDRVSGLVLDDTFLSGDVTMADVQETSNVVFAADITLPASFTGTEDVSHPDDTSVLFAGFVSDTPDVFYLHAGDSDDYGGGTAAAGLIVPITRFIASDSGTLVFDVRINPGRVRAWWKGEYLGKADTSGGGALKGSAWSEDDIAFGDLWGGSLQSGLRYYENQLVSNDDPDYRSFAGRNPILQVETPAGTISQVQALAALESDLYFDPPRLWLTPDKVLYAFTGDGLLCAAIMPSHALSAVSHITGDAIGVPAPGVQSTAIDQVHAFDAGLEVGPVLQGAALGGTSYLAGEIATATAGLDSATLEQGHDLDGAGLEISATVPPGLHSATSNFVGSLVALETSVTPASLAQIQSLSGATSEVIAVLQDTALSTTSRFVGEEPVLSPPTSAGSIVQYHELSGDGLQGAPVLPAAMLSIDIALIGDPIVVQAVAPPGSIDQRHDLVLDEISLSAGSSTAMLTGLHALAGAILASQPDTALGVLNLSALFVGNPAVVAANVGATSVVQGHDLDVNEVGTSLEISSGTLFGGHSLAGLVPVATTDISETAFTQFHGLATADLVVQSDTAQSAIASIAYFVGDVILEAGDINPAVVEQNHSLALSDISVGPTTQPINMTGRHAQFGDGVASTAAVAELTIEQDHLFSTDGLSSQPQTAHAILTGDTDLIGEPLVIWADVEDAEFNQSHDIAGTDLIASSDIAAGEMAQRHALSGESIEVKGQLPSKMLTGKSALLGNWVTVQLDLPNTMPWQRHEVIGYDIALQADVSIVDVSYLPSANKVRIPFAASIDGPLQWSGDGRQPTIGFSARVDAPTHTKTVRRSNHSFVAVADDAP